MNNSKVKYIWISLVSLIIIVLGIYGKWLRSAATEAAVLKAADEKQISAIGTLKAEGCLPARNNTTAIRVIQRDVQSILEIQNRQDGKLDKILERLPQ